MIFKSIININTTCSSYDEFNIYNNTIIFFLFHYQYLLKKTVPYRNALKTFHCQVLNKLIMNSY